MFSLKDNNYPRRKSKKNHHKFMFSQRPAQVLFDVFIFPKSPASMQCMEPMGELYTSKGLFVLGSFDPSGSKHNLESSEKCGHKEMTR